MAFSATVTTIRFIFVVAVVAAAPTAATSTAAGYPECK